MKQNLILLLNGVMIAVVLLLYYTHAGRFTFTLKCVCSGLVGALAGVNLLVLLLTRHERPAFIIAMALGLGFAVLGDVLIQSSFLQGAAAFGVGHLGFLVAYCTLQKPRPLDFLLSGVIFLGVLLFFKLSPLHFDLRVYKIACVLYALVISFMLGKAIALLIGGGSLFTGVIAAGAALFFCSDFFLLLHQFLHAGSWADRACLSTYYPALCLLALSLPLC